MNTTGIARFTNRLWTGAAATGDLNPGGASAFPGNPNAYIGQLGATERLNFATAQALSDSAVTQTLQGGRYQYVQFAADGTNYALGQVLYWKDETNYIVTNVAPTTTSANVAGVCIAPVTQGNYWVMQTHGVVWVQYRAAVTSTAVSAGVYLLVNTNTADALADATADATSGVNKLFLGIAKDAPANGTIGRVYVTTVVTVE